MHAGVCLSASSNIKTRGTAGLNCVISRLHLLFTISTLVLRGGDMTHSVNPEAAKIKALERWENEGGRVVSQELPRVAFDVVPSKNVPKASDRNSSRGDGEKSAGR